LPLERDELKTLKSASQFTMKDMLKRIRTKGAKAPQNPKGQKLP
jgi:DNA primase